MPNSVECLSDTQKTAMQYYLFSKILFMISTRRELAQWWYEYESSRISGGFKINIIWATFLWDGKYPILKKALNI